MSGACERSDGIGEKPMTWEVDTPALTAPVARRMALALGFVFALSLGVSHILAPGASAAALGWAAATTGTAAVLAGLVVFGLLSNRIRRRFSVTADGYVAAIADARIAWALPGEPGRASVRRWDRVERVRLDAENGRVLVQLAGEGWEAIWCPAGGFVPTAREVRRLIDAAKGIAVEAPPEAWTRGPTAGPIPGPIPGPLSNKAA